MTITINRAPAFIRRIKKHTVASPIIHDLHFQSLLMKNTLAAYNWLLECFYSNENFTDDYYFWLLFSSPHFLYPRFRNQEVLSKGLPQIKKEMRPVYDNYNFNFHPKYRPSSPADDC